MRICCRTELSMIIFLRVRHRRGAQNIRYVRITIVFVGRTLFSLRRDSQTASDRMLTYGVRLESGDDENVLGKIGGTRKAGGGRQNIRASQPRNQHLKRRSNIFHWTFRFCRSNQYYRSTSIV